VTDPERIRVSRLVEVTEDPAITARGSVYRHMVHVKVTLRDGTVLDETVETPRGSEYSFASAEQVIAKFRKLTSHRLTAVQSECIIEQVMQAEKMSSANDLVKLLATSH
jgi:2-methylcitrate dehydratase PrpD